MSRHPTVPTPESWDLGRIFSLGLSSFFFFLPFLFLNSEQDYSGKMFKKW